MAGSGLSTDALTRIDLIARTLVDRAAPASILVARSDADVAAAQRIRGRALLERGWATSGDLVDGREIAEGDDRATHLLALIDGEPIGTCRLIYSMGDSPLPLENLAIGTQVPRPVVEVGRVAVVAGHGRTQHSLTAGLIARAWLEIRLHGYGRICGIVSGPMVRLYRRLGFLVEIIGTPVMIFGEKRFPIVFEPTTAAAAAAAARTRGGERAS